MAKRKASVSEEGESEEYSGSEAPVPDAGQSRSKSKPSVKKPKPKKITSADEESEADPRPAKKPKRGGKKDSPEASGSTKVLKTKEGDNYVDLGKKKHATVRTFKGTQLLDIREFYEAGGEQKPGKKGISLTLDQWNALKAATDAIDKLFLETKK